VVPVAGEEIDAEFVEVADLPQIVRGARLAEKNRAGVVAARQASVFCIQADRSGSR